jgi:hypothetical protein
MEIFVWPVWLVMTHSLLVGGLAHVLGRKVPGVSRRATVVAIVGWAFWSAVMLYAGWWRARDQGGLWPAWVLPRAAIGPAVLVVLFAVTIWRKVRVHGRGPRAAEKIARYGALWLALYACLWLAGQAYWNESMILGAPGRTSDDRIKERPMAG